MCFCLNMIIDNILQPFLPAADLFRFAIGQRKITQVFKFQFSFFKFFSFSAVERSISVFTEFLIRRI